MLLSPTRGDQSLYSSGRQSELAEDMGNESPRSERGSLDEESTMTHGLVWKRDSDGYQRHITRAESRNQRVGQPQGKVRPTTRSVTTTKTRTGRT